MGVLGGALRGRVRDRPRVVRGAGLAKKLRVHDLRHTRASWLIQSGRPLPAVQQYLVDGSIQTTVGITGTWTVPVGAITRKQLRDCCVTADSYAEATKEFRA